MKTLLTLFNQERNQLETEINQATSFKQVVQLVQNQLDHVEQSYIGELSVTQVRLVKLFLDALRQSEATLTTANETTISSSDSQPIINQPQRVSPNKLILKLLQVLISIAILFSLFSLTEETPAAWMAILLMSVLLGLQVSLQFDKDQPANSFTSSEPIETPQLNGQVNSKFLLDNLADALGTIDRAVAQATAVKKPIAAGGIEEMPEILDFLQKLWGASFIGNPQMALEISKLVPQILMEQGIRVQNYQPFDELSSREYFDFEPSLDSSTKDYVTLTPALLKGDRLLRRGRVIEPATTGED